MERTDMLNVLRRAGRQGAGVPLMVVALLAMMVIPLPPLALDMLFTFNIALSLVILLATIYALRPLDFAVFPTLLLVVTLLRLALNVASTRVVLLEGHSGTGAAGQVIESFGEFVIGGNYAVGLVVFAILVIINFVVVTKGAGRISEVSARFTLDALPGKQMAIDADLNAGLLTQEEARDRRAEVAQEADFYGAMDGASKFVRGDAIAGILILFINIVGGLAIGVAQHGMPFGEAARTYTLLTIGDGLVAQIPSLVLSTAAGILVTRTSSSEDMGGQILRQAFGKPRVLAVTAGVLGLMGVIPGMPNLPFLLLATLAGGGAYLLSRRQAEAARQPAKQEVATTPQKPETKELTWEDVHPVDVVGLEVGYGLIPLVDRQQEGVLLTRIKGVRKKLSQELGFLIPSVHIRDNLDLGPNTYRFSLSGVPVAEAEVHPGRELAIDPGAAQGALEGIRGRDPAFGLEAIWINPAQRDQAQALGYTVVDASTVVATHLSQLVQENAQDLLGHDEAQQLLDRLSRQAPKLVEDLVPKVLPLSVVVRVLQNLLSEGIPIRDVRTIVETLAEKAPGSQDPVILTAAVREALGRLIVQHINGMAEELPVMALDPQLEQLLHQSLRNADENGLGLEPGLAERLMTSVRDNAQQQEMAGQPAVLLTSPQLRPWLVRLLRPAVAGLHVLAYTEIPDNKQLKVVATIGQERPSVAAVS